MALENGGDPARLTIAGQSAGAQSVLALDGLAFDLRAVQRRHRPKPLRDPSHSHAKPKKTGVALAIAMGLAGAQASAASLRRIPADRLAEHGQKISRAYSFIVGDEAISMPLFEAFQKGREHAVPLIIGSNSADASVVEPEVVIDAAGRVLGTLSVGTHKVGYKQLLCWAQTFGLLRRAGVEGTSSYGAALTHVLQTNGVKVIETNRPDRSRRRGLGKSDATDAECAARAVLAGDT